MNPGFQEGRRPRANAVASLASTGHATPLGRRPGVGLAPHAHQSAAGRPGPRPMSARQTADVNKQNFKTQKVALQTTQHTAAIAMRLNQTPYSAYDPRKYAG